MRQREREHFLVLRARFSVKERFLVLWVRLVLKRVFPCALGTLSVKERVYGCYRHDSYDFGCEKWSVYWCLSDELGIGTQWFEVRAYTRQSIR
jgi:hypothetical protein